MHDAGEHLVPLLPDRRLTAVRGQLKFLPQEERAKFKALIEVNSNMILFLDPPTHTRLRGLVAQAFSARRIEGLRLRIQEIVDEWLNQAEESREWELMDVPWPIPCPASPPLLLRWISRCVVCLARGVDTRGTQILALTRLGH